jgi:methyl-accepting chemotaxis protein
MRRVLFRVLGTLELLVALVLLAFAGQLPGPGEIHVSVGRVEEVSRRTSRQILQVREQVVRARQTRPQMELLAKRLDEQMRLIGQTLRRHPVDFEAVDAVGSALESVADGLDGVALVLDPKGIAQLGSSLRATADFLEQRAAPAAEKAAERLEKTTRDLETDALRLKVLLEKRPLDWQSARALVRSLRDFERGLDRLGTFGKDENLAALVEGFQGLRDSLEGTAGRVEKLQDQQIPQVKLKGFGLDVENKPLWPESKGVAEGLRKAARGAAAARQEMETIQKEMPRMRASVENSRKVVTATREALSEALRQEEKLKPLLEDVPLHAARLAEELPRLGSELVRVLRDTARLREVAGLLRQAQKGVETASARWPELRTDLARTASVLRTTQKQLQRALEHRDHYQEALRQTVEMAETFAGTLPEMTQQLDEELQRQEASLTELSESIDRVSEMLPPAARGATRLFVTARVLLALVAVLVGVHAAWVMIGPSNGRGAGS